MFESLDAGKLGKSQLKITALSSAGSFLDGYDIAIISVAILVLDTQFSLSGAESTVLLGATLIGMILGGVTVGYLTDLKGRRNLFLWDMALFIVFTILTAVSTSFVQIAVFRLFLGVAIGADYAISPTIISEIAPARHRGKLLTISGLAWFVGAAASYAAGAFLAPLGTVSWRYMFLLGVIPAVAVLLLRFSIPESPRWLMEQGRTKDAEESLRKLGSGYSGASTGSAPRVSIRSLFSRQYLLSTIFVSVFWFCLDAATYAIALEGPSVLVVLGISRSSAAGLSSIIAFLSIIGGLLAFMVVDRIGRRPITIAGFIGMFVTLIASAIVLEFSLSVSLLIVVLIVFEISQQLGPGITNNLYPQELFPTHIRATAQGFGTTVSRIGALSGIFMFEAVAQPYGFSWALVVLALVSLVGLVATLRLGVETKGLSLEKLTVEQ